MNGIDNFFVALAVITVADHFICKKNGKEKKPFLINAMASGVIAAILGVMY